MYSQRIVGLSGLPRSGTTLLSALLSQNPTIHAEGNSAVCQLMWDMQQSCKTSASEQLKANRRDETAFDLISHIPKIYYRHVPSTTQLIIDKCRSWTMLPNLIMFKKYIEMDAKIIVLERPLQDIVKSFGKLFQANKLDAKAVLPSLLTPNSEPIMRSLEGIKWAKQNNRNNNFLFVQYDDLINQPAELMARIYEFMQYPPFTHNFQNIIIKHPEDDGFYNLKGFHSIRPTLAKQPNNFVLSADIAAQCIWHDMQKK
jgi:sulfotransferase